MFVSAEATYHLLDLIMVCWILLWLVMFASVRTHLSFVGFDYGLLDYTMVANDCFYEKPLLRSTIVC